MTTERPKAQQWDRNLRRASIGGLAGGPALRLGELRALVDAAHELPDDAEVTVEHLVKHYGRIDEYEIKQINVRSEEAPGDR